MNIKVLIMVLCISSACAYGMDNDEDTGRAMRSAATADTARNREEFRNLRQQYSALKHSLSPNRTAQLRELGIAVEDLESRTSDARLKRAIGDLKESIHVSSNPNQAPFRSLDLGGNE